MNTTTEARTRLAEFAVYKRQKAEALDDYLCWRRCAGDPEQLQNDPLLIGLVEDVLEGIHAHLWGKGLSKEKLQESDWTQTTVRIKKFLLGKTEFPRTAAGWADITELTVEFLNLPESEWLR